MSNLLGHLDHLLPKISAKVALTSVTHSLKTAIAATTGVMQSHGSSSYQSTECHSQYPDLSVAFQNAHPKHCVYNIECRLPA